MLDTSNTIYLLDGTSLCYRSFFALRLSNSKGLPTGAVYGVLQALKKIQKKFSPNYIGFCLDVSRKTFRQERFKAYKIHRPPAPSDLKIQIPIIKQLVEAFGIKILEKEGFEADDLIASITKKAVAKNLDVVIVSSDKDIYQLLFDSKVSIFDPTDEKLYTRENFLKEYGFLPTSIVDYLALVGDQVDNVPGAKGIGKVTATKLIKEFGTIENMFNNLEKIPKKIHEILIQQKEKVFLSKELVKLEFLDLDIQLEELKVKQQDYKKIYKICNELEFKSILKELPIVRNELKIDIKDLEEEDLQKILREDILFFDLEDDTLYIFEPKENLMYQGKIDKLINIIADENIKKVTYDFKGKLHIIGDRLKGIYFDVMVAGYLLEPTLLDYSLENLVSFYLEEFLRDIPSQTAPYFIYKLYELFLEKLKQDSLLDLFFNVEMPLVEILFEMERNGVKVDEKKLDELLDEVESKIKKIEEEIFSIAKRPFNLNSPQQLQVVLFQDLKIPPLQKTKTGYSTSEEVLEKLASQYKIAELILEYRQLNKLKTTYITPFKNMLDNESKLHANFSQTATQTGRLACSSPNLQSIPTKGEFASFLRDAFVSSFKEGYILSADYSQIELRILAHFSSDQNLISAFKEDKDIHSFTASLLFAVPEEAVNQKQRNLAKRINFSIIYGMSSYGLANELNISPEEAQKFIDDYFLRYPAVKNYIEKIQKEASQFGFVKTILGRKRSLPDINSSNQYLREAALRQAINTPIQGSCADLIKLAMVKIYKNLKEKNLKAKLIIQIHDELIFDVPSDELEIVKSIIKENMQNAITLSVPIKVNLKVAKSWGQLKEVS